MTERGENDRLVHNFVIMFTGMATRIVFDWIYSLVKKRFGRKDAEKTPAKKEP